MSEETAALVNAVPEKLSRVKAAAQVAARAAAQAPARAIARATEKLAPPTQPKTGVTLASALGEKKYDWFDVPSAAPRAPAEEPAPEPTAPETSSEPLAADPFHALTTALVEQPARELASSLEMAEAALDECAASARPLAVAVATAVGVEEELAEIEAILSDESWEESPTAAVDSALAQETPSGSELPPAPVAPIAQPAEAPQITETPHPEEIPQTAETLAPAPIAQLAETPAPAPIAQLAETPAPAPIAQPAEIPAPAPVAADSEIEWLGQIRAATDALLRARDAKLARGEDVRAEDARIRLLYLAIGEYDRASRATQSEQIRVTSA
ncbi:MAG: hypothetical protein HUK22_00085 [Thermoguttaceae bacterium]|nr:hypothetical protein [Thermoguttaceae bacterium]